MDFPAGQNCKPTCTEELTPCLALKPDRRPTGRKLAFACAEQLEIEQKQDQEGAFSISKSFHLGILSIRFWKSPFGYFGKGEPTTKDDGTTSHRRPPEVWESLNMKVEVFKHSWWDFLWLNDWNWTGEMVFHCLFEDELVADRDRYVLQC